MGATLDFNILSKELIDIQFMLQWLDENLEIKISIKKIESMDDWEYKNQIELSNLFELDDYINRNKIIIINLSNPYNWNIGIYIEKVNGMILYNLWFDTSSCFVLDSDDINENNRKKYYNFYEIASILFKKYQSSILIVSIGVETIFQYNKEIDLIISETYNVNSWIMHEKSIININGYSERYIDALDLIVFEKTSTIHQ